MPKASTSSASFLVFALRPCEVLDHVIREAKINTRAIAGEQVYLSHPPHLTLYVAAFDEPERAAARCEELLANWSPPQFDVVGWHHFAGDVLTGQQTLVCQISKTGSETLRKYQASLIEAVHALRDATLSLERYRPHFETLSLQRQQSVQSVGFPFTGSDWIPHFTVASVEPARWEPLWNALKKQPPQGHFTCDRLSIFRLVDDFPTGWREIPLRNEIVID